MTLREQITETLVDEWYQTGDWQKCVDALLPIVEAALQAEREALDWYAERAKALNRYMTAKPPKVQAMTAVVTELSPDNGQRALAAIRARAEEEPHPLP